MVFLSDLKTESEFENLLPKLTQEQFVQLEKNMIEYGGARNALIAWAGHNIIVDGHNRFRILKAHPELKLYRIIEQEFEDEDAVKEFIIANALGTRNLTEPQFKTMVSQLYKLRKKKHGGTGANQYTKKVQSAQNEHTAEKKPNRVADEIANEFGVSRETVKRSEQYDDGLTAADKVIPGTRDRVLAGELKAQNAEVMGWSKGTPEQIKASVKVVEDRKGKKKERQTQVSKDRELLKKIDNIAEQMSGVPTTQYSLSNLLNEIDALGNSFALSLGSTIRQRKSVMDSYSDGPTKVSDHIEEIIQKLITIKKGIENG